MSTLVVDQMDLDINLGPMPMDDQSGCILNGLRGLIQSNHLCDIVLATDTQDFPAHWVVLAAASPTMRHALAHDLGAAALTGAHQKLPVIRLDGVSHPEAVQAMLGHVYGTVANYDATSEEVNWDVLQLARRFDLGHLKEEAARWLARGLTASNVLRRLAACEEFGLSEVRSKILEQVTASPEALSALARHPDATKSPLLLQDLLVRILNLLGADDMSGTANPHMRIGGA